MLFTQPHRTESPNGAICSKIIPLLSLFNRYIAKAKNNQKLLKDKVVQSLNNFVKAIESHKDSKAFKTENSNQSVKRAIDIFYNRDANIVMYHDKFKILLVTEY